MNLQDFTWICPLILKNFTIILRKSYAVSIEMAGKLTAPFSSLSLQQFGFSRSRSIVKYAKISFLSAMDLLQQKLHMEF